MLRMLLEKEVQCVGRLAAFADLLVFAAELPKDFAGGAARQAVRQIARLPEPATTHGGVAGHAGQELLDIVSFLRYVGEGLNVSRWWIGQLAAGIASRLKGDATHHVTPAAVLRQPINEYGKTNVPRGGCDVAG